MIYRIPNNFGPILPENGDRAQVLYYHIANLQNP